MKRRMCSSVVLPLGLGYAVLWAQAPVTSPHLDSGSAKMMKSADTSFAIRAAQTGFAEIELGKLAVARAASADVKAFAQQMIDDYTRANDQLRLTAQKQAMTLPASFDSHDQSAYAKLHNLTGVAFDKAYMKAMTKDHHEDVEEFHKEATAGKDPYIKSFAAETLPVLESHLERAKSLDSTLTAASRNAASPR